MPYVGRDPRRGNYLKLDDIQSSFNGSDKTFNLTSGGTAYYPDSTLSVLVSVGGTVLEPATDYGITNNQINNELNYRKTLAYRHRFPFDQDQVLKY